MIRRKVDVFENYLRETEGACLEGFVKSNTRKFEERCSIYEIENFKILRSFMANIYLQIYIKHPPIGGCLM